MDGLLIIITCGRLKAIMLTHALQVFSDLSRIILNCWREKNIDIQNRSEIFKKELSLSSLGLRFLIYLGMVQNRDEGLLIW